MTLTQLQCFVELANCGSFSRAAENLYISQPSLTRAIASLEKELCIRLFDRSTHHVRLTPAGEYLVLRTERLITEFASAVEEVRSKEGGGIRRVTIGVLRDESLPEELVKLLQQLNTSDGDCRYVIQQDTFAGLISGLRGRKYDLVVGADRNIRNAADIEFIPLRNIELMLALYKGHPLAEQENILDMDFGDEPVFFALPGGKDMPPHFLHALRERVGGPINVQVMDSARDIMLNVQNEAGVAVVTTLIDRNDYPNVVFKYFDNPKDLIQCVAWRADETDPVVLEFIDNLRKVFSKS